MEEKTLANSVREYYRARIILIWTTVAYVGLSIFIGYVGAYVANKPAYSGHLLAGMSDATEKNFEALAAVNVIFGVLLLMAALLYFGKKRKILVRAVGEYLGTKKISHTQILNKHSLLLDATDTWFAIGEGKKAFIGISNQLELTLVLGLPTKAPHMLLLSKHGGVKYKDLLQLEGKPHELEGDFGQYYQYYMAQNSHVEALALITPDNMAELIDVDYPLNVEFIDDIIIFRSAGLVKGADNEFESFLEIAQRLMSEFNPEMIVSSNSTTSTYLGGHNLSREANRFVYVSSASIAWLRYKLDHAKEEGGVYSISLVIITILVLGAPFLLGNWLAQIFHG